MADVEGTYMRKGVFFRARPKLPEWSLCNVYAKVGRAC